MQRNLASGFDDSFRRHLAVEQRRAVLETIAHELTPDTTLGDIVDAAQDLGWADSLGELSLSDLAAALLGGEPPTSTVTAPAVQQDDEEDEDEDEDEDDSDELEDDGDEDEDEDAEDEEEEEEAPAKRGRKSAKAEPAAAQRKPSSLDRALDRIDKALAARRKVRPEGRGKVASKATSKAASKVAAKVTKAGKKLAKKAAASKRAPIIEDEDDTDAMSLEQAAKLLVPLVRKLREATMQDLEEQTHMGRRKLRFHIGQLVKHGRLKRHGMGRGTCYTVK